MDLRWRASFSASCLHVAAGIHAGLPVVETKLITGQLTAAVSALAAELSFYGIAAAENWNLLVGLAAELENNHVLAQAFLSKLRGPVVTSEQTIRLAGQITDLETALRQSAPRLVEELAVSGTPLREQWAAHGPGLLHRLGRLTEDTFLVPNAEVVYVVPFSGGHGRAHLANNRVTFEAVPTNSQTNLPETLRLGWLLAQLNLELPRYSELIPGPQRQTLAGLATLPLVLCAAEQIEWIDFHESAIQQALSAWHLPDTLPADAPQRLLAWWQTYFEGNTSWAVAMAALPALLGE